MERIYLDHAATSPIHPDVVRVFTELLPELYGNPSSIHDTGRKSRKVLDDARAVFAGSIGAQESEIILTSGGTEADNMAIFGTAANHKKGHIITSAIEHHAVLNACKRLDQQGWDVTFLPVDENGLVRAEDVREALRDDTVLVTIMLGNNEVGTIQPIADIGRLLQDHPAVFHTDAVQAYGVLPIDVNKLGVDLLSVSAHKLNGPKGIGFLYQRKGVKLSPLLFGGEQEKKRRAGTENVPAAAAFAKAVSIAQETMEAKAEEFRRYKDIFREAFRGQGIPFKENGADQLPHVLNISIPGIGIEPFLVNLDLAGISASSGSACTAGSVEPSHVLIAMYGESADEGRNSVRFSFGLGLTEETVTEAAQKAAQIAARLTN
ncbi:cysteine desulfurase family protein [Indiicoccus explosivorum]|uniref:cysteine desulfurase family protein n=1 Tax=Indiicoccus explosivorum TaxID=1917864 RepID=UPI000B448B29|nr:cysteine desulfurase family protein [Indiicoccus explosivorum]